MRKAGQSLTVILLALILLTIFHDVEISFSSLNLFLNRIEVTPRNSEENVTRRIRFPVDQANDKGLAQQKAELDHVLQNYSRVLVEQQGYLDLIIKNVSLTQGIDEAYLDLFIKSRDRTNQDWPTIKFKGQRGVLIGPVAGSFHHCMMALRNARRIRSILPRNQTVKVKIAIMLSHEFKLRLENCVLGRRGKQQDACRLWDGGALFDDVLVMEEDLPYQINTAHAMLHESGYSPKYWMQALSGYLSAPYVETLFLDSNAHPCPGFEKLFSILLPFSEKLWTLPSNKVVDFAAGVDQYSHAAAYLPDLPFWCPGDPKILKDFVNFAERNTGTVLLNFRSSLTRHFAHFVPLVAEHVYNKVATPSMKIINDQAPFRIALYVFRRLAPDFNEQVLPLHTSCRTTAGWEHTNIDGDLNGMFPHLENGNRCRICFCTPCLISHGTNIAVEGNKFGWEPGFSFSYNASAYSG